MHWKTLYLTLWNTDCGGSNGDHEQVMLEQRNGEQLYTSDTLTIPNSLTTIGKKNRSEINKKKELAKSTKNMPPLGFSDPKFIDRNIPTLLKSQRGADHLVYKGYRYRKRHEMEDSIAWRCVITNCKGNLTTDYNNNLLSLTKALHNHDNNQKKINRIHLITQIKVLRQYDYIFCYLMFMFRNMLFPPRRSLVIYEKLFWMTYWYF